MGQWVPSGPGVAPDEPPSGSRNIPASQSVTFSWHARTARRISINNPSSATLFVAIDSDSADSSAAGYTFKVGSGESVFYDGKVSKVSIAHDAVNSLSWGSDFYVRAWF